MKEVNEANTVLSDPEKRAAYDQVGQGRHAGEEFRPPPDWDAGFEFSGRDFSGGQGGDFSDFFSELFGRQGARAGRGARFDARGEDRHARILIDLEDAYQGASRLVTLRVPGADERGRVAMTEHSLDVRIPKGVHEGQVLRLAGQGSPGLGDGPPGDLYLEIHFNTHPRFRVEGQDVYATLRVAPWEAALGATVKAALPVGAVEVRVPEGSQTGRKLRLKERGIPGTPPGDLYLVVEVVLPRADTPKARELYQKMASELAFNPRESES
jgi:curved DNA-binding protein